jgi:hypothetical protein
LEEVTVRAGRKDLMEVDDNSPLIACNPQGIFSPTAQASPNPLIKHFFYILTY